MSDHDPAAALSSLASPTALQNALLEQHYLADEGLATLLPFVVAPDGRTLATGSRDGTVDHWDVGE